METNLSGGFVGECNVFIRNKLRENGRASGGLERRRQKIPHILSNIFQYCREAAWGADFGLSTGYPQHKNTHRGNCTGRRNTNIEHKRDAGIV